MRVIRLDQEPQLFSDRRLTEMLNKSCEGMLAEIAQYEPNQLLNTCVDDLVAYFTDKFSMAPVKISESEIYVDLAQPRSSHQGETLNLPGTIVVLSVPFQGDPKLFSCIPKQYTYNPPHGNISGNTLELSVYRRDHDEQAVRRELGNKLERVQEYVSWINDELEDFKQSLQEKARRHIEARRKKILDDRGLVASLGFPLRKRNDDPTTYVSPVLRRRLIPKPPPASTDPYVPEPALSMEQYEHILDVITKTAIMLERSPKAFKGMDEEDLRDQFLVPLNSHYEGQVTGETFTFSGKTDILVRDGDRSVFVAECKIWRGPKYFSEAIDQLRGQATWRDTKTAILVFNRNKDFSAVLDEIPTTVRKHKSYKRDVEEYSHESGFRFILGHRDDPNRELTLTVLAFEVPK